MKKWIALGVFLWIVLQSTLVSGQNWLLLEYQNKKYIQIDSLQLANANSTKVTLDGCIDVVNAYREAKFVGDSLLAKKGKEVRDVKNQLGIALELNAIDEQVNKGLGKSLKKMTNKNKGNAILFYVSLGVAAGFGILYLTK